MSGRRRRSAGQGDGAPAAAPTVVYVPRHRTHPARYAGVEYEVRHFDPAGSADVDREGRAALGLPEPEPPAVSEEG